jgi:hypothetical protein
MLDSKPPVIGGPAPGLAWRPRMNEWVAYWQCRTDLARLGHKPTIVRLWNGTEINETDRAFIMSECERLQSEMLIFSQGGLPDGGFSGKVLHLSRLYQMDADSTFRKLRYQSRKYYMDLLGVIERDHGMEELREIKARTLLRWHEDWQKRGQTMARALLRMLRTLFTFGATILEDEECERLCGVMSKMRFPMPPKRNVIITAAQVEAVRAKAHEMGYPSLALAQAFQFDCLFRQKDVIGEYVPESEPGMSDVIRDSQKWLRGIRWNEIDANLILKHTTSKRQKEIEIDLKLCPMVMAELARFGDVLPASGPVITRESTGLPWPTNSYRVYWRQVAAACGIPKGVKNMDSRAGGITEASDAGAPLEHIRHAATHSDTKTTAGYSRGSVSKTAEVLRLRAAHREKK